MTIWNASFNRWDYEPEYDPPDPFARCSRGHILPKKMIQREWKEEWTAEGPSYREVRDGEMADRIEVWCNGCKGWDLVC